MRFKFVSIVVALGLCLGCSGGSSNALRDAVSDAVYDSTRSQDPPFDISRDTAKCVADGVLADSENKKLLQEAFDDGKTGSDLMDAVPGDETDTLMNCMTKDEIVTIMRDVFITNLTEDAEALKCMSDAIDSFTVAELREMFIGIASNDFETDAFLKFSDTMSDCGVDAEPTDAEVTAALAQALFDANQQNTDVPFKVTEAEAQCVAETLMSDPELNAVYTQAFKDGKTGREFVRAEGSDSDKSTVASINCLSKAKLVSAMGSIIKDSTSGTKRQIECFEDALSKSVTVEELRQLFLDIEDDQMTDANAAIINQAAGECGIAG